MVPHGARRRGRDADEAQRMAVTRGGESAYQAQARRNAGLTGRGSAMKLRAFAASLGCGFLLAGCRPAPAPRVTVSGNSPYGLEGIRVTATALVRAQPELAVVRLGCTTESPTASAARRANDGMMAAVVGAVRRAGVARKDIQTVDYQLTRLYRNQYPQGWKVVNVVDIRIRRVEDVPTVLDRAQEAGANTIYWVRYEVEELQALRIKALTEACRVAREKADRMASEMGVRRGKLVALSDTSVQAGTPWYPWFSRYGANTVAQSVVQAGAGESLDAVPDSALQAGQIAVEARVEAVFDIE